MPIQELIVSELSKRSALALHCLHYLLNVQENLFCIFNVADLCDNIQLQTIYEESLFWQACIIEYGYIYNRLDCVKDSEVSCCQCLTGKG